ncbi:MAG TPA: phage holin family protein [Caulobacteraceae bacterium]|nr:phage holin family protein [Caulobacteraceae bacterium]
MVRFVLRAFAAALGFWLAMRFVPGIYAASPAAMIGAGALLAIASGLVRPTVAAAGLPVSAVTVIAGLIAVNTALLQFSDRLLAGLQIAGLQTAFLGAVVVSLTVWICGYFIEPAHERSPA